MGKVVIDFTMIGEPVNMMQTVMREVQTFCEELGKEAEPIQKEIMEAPTIAQIEGILKREFNGELIIRDKYKANNTHA